MHVRSDPSNNGGIQSPLLWDISIYQLVHRMFVHQLFQITPKQTAAVTSAGKPCQQHVFEASRGPLHPRFQIYTSNGHSHNATIKKTNIHSIMITSVTIMIFFYDDHHPHHHHHHHHHHDHHHHHHFHVSSPTFPDFNKIKKKKHVFPTDPWTSTSTNIHAIVIPIDRSFGPTFQQFRRSLVGHLGLDLAEIDNTSMVPFTSTDKFRSAIGRVGFFGGPTWLWVCWNFGIEL